MSLVGSVWTRSMGFGGVLMAKLSAGMSPRFPVSIAFRIFFFQAEDGIRDYKVTGVQTCALPISLGQVAIGAMGNDEALLAEVREAGERAGERCWPLPLWDEYRDLLKSDIADVKNSGGRGAGSIAGGWVLRGFVEGDPSVRPHIAGTAYTDGEGPHQ